MVEYELASHDENELQLHIYANTSAPTIVNLTNHAYWNLSGDAKRNIYSHFLHLASHHVLPVDTTQIPTGELKYVVEQPPSDNSESGSHTLGNFDFVSEERPRKLNEALLTSIVLDEQDREKGRPGLDHCFVVDGYEPAIEGLTPYAAVADAVANVGDGTQKGKQQRPHLLVIVHCFCFVFFLTRMPWNIMQLPAVSYFCLSYFPHLIITITEICFLCLIFVY